MDNIEEVAENLKRQADDNEALKIQGASKVYPNGKKAVDRMSLTMY